MVGRRVHLTRLGHNGRVQLPPEVLAGLGWKGGDYVKIEIDEQGRVEVTKVTTAGVVPPAADFRGGHFLDF
ncbi:MAG: hypothetical protein PWP65_1094 [Clostridia bacterium]|nr:hypothetical protein [Clostridia bacterium]